MATKSPIIYAFIDSQNLNLGVRDQGWKLDFGKFAVYLQDSLKVKKAFLFIGYLLAKKIIFVSGLKEKVELYSKNERH